MGFERKGAKGAWWSLLLAGLLLAMAVTAGAEEVGGDAADECNYDNDSCDLKCVHWQDPARRQQCVDECHSREHHHPSHAFCEMKCQHWQDQARKQQCVTECEQRGARVGGSRGVADEGAEEVGGGDDDEHSYDNDSCDLKCVHWQDPARRQQCVDECHSREHHHPSHEFCEMKCQHWQDQARKQQCVTECEQRGLRAGVADEDSSPYCHRCSRSCIPSGRRRDFIGCKVCMRRCRPQLGGRGRERGHGWEAVAGAILEVV